MGFGTVGRGVAELLTLHPERHAQRAGQPLTITHVLVRDEIKERPTPPPEGALLTDEPEVFFNGQNAEGPPWDLLIEVAGGIEAPNRIITRAIEAGRDVVTANKSLIAARADELFALAEERRVRIGFEAAVAGGLPVVAALDALHANDFRDFAGILNATCTFVLSQMRDEGHSYSEAINAARRLGYAEADPTLDVSGRDAAEKLAILATLLFQRRVHPDAIRTTGITRITTEDMRLARELGYAIQLLARALRADDRVYLRVAPMLIPLNDPIARIRGAMNAAFFLGDAVGGSMIAGEGAGGLPTASAVVADAIRLATLTHQRAPGRLNPWPIAPEPLDIAPAGETEKRFFIRAPISHHDGVVEAFTQHLRAHDIALERLHELPDTLAAIVGPVTRQHLDATLEQPCCNGINVEASVVLRVYTPQMTW